MVKVLIVKRALSTRMSPNDETLRVYDERISSYIQNTPAKYNRTHTSLLKWIDFFLSTIPKTGNILEIGSGPGRDALYIKSRGYNILCSDGAPGFVEYLKKKGQSAICLNILKDKIDKKYDLIFANAVMPHFTPEELEQILIKIHGSLKSKGMLAFNVKQGSNTLWTREKLNDPRFIHQWRLTDICNLVVKQGFTIKKVSHGIKGDLPSHLWVQLTLQKRD